MLAAIGGGWRPGFFASLLAGSQLLGGCAINNVGTLAANVHRANGAWVVDVYSLGGYIHGRADDPGAQFGFGRRSYVFDLQSNEELVPGWHFFSVDILDRPALAIDSWTAGMEMGFASDNLSATLGMVATTQIVRRNASDDIAYALSYRSAEPQETTFFLLHPSTD